MKFYALALSLVLFLMSACQNSDSAEKAAQAADNTAANAQKDVQAPVLDMAQLQKAAADAQATADEMQNLLKSLYDLPEDVKKKQADLIASTRNDLTGMLEKHQSMLETFNKLIKDYAPADGNGQLSGAQQASDSQVADPVAVANGSMVQFEQYAQTLPRYKERIEQLKAGK